MSEHGHCNHCDRERCGKYPMPSRGDIHGAKYAQWTSGHCPACAAADLIEAEVYRLADAWCWDASRVRDYVGDDAGNLQGMLDAALIARGKE